MSPSPTPLRPRYVTVEVLLTGGENCPTAAFTTGTPLRHSCPTWAVERANQATPRAANGRWREYLLVRTMRENGPDLDLSVKISRTPE